MLLFLKISKSDYLQDFYPVTIFLKNYFAKIDFGHFAECPKLKYRISFVNFMNPKIVFISTF